MKVAIAGFGGVGRAIAHLLLSRRERYRRLYGTDVRLVAVCSSTSGLADPDGLDPERLDGLETSLIITHLRKNAITDIGEVREAYMEADGEISILRL